MINYKIILIIYFHNYGNESKIIYNLYIFLDMKKIMTMMQKNQIM
jgi:hypothetical protein